MSNARAEALKLHSPLSSLKLAKRIPSREDLKNLVFGISNRTVPDNTKMTKNKQDVESTGKFSVTQVSKQTQRSSSLERSKSNPKTGQIKRNRHASEKQNVDNSSYISRIKTMGTTIVNRISAVKDPAAVGSAVKRDDINLPMQ